MKAALALAAVVLAILAGSRLLAALRLRRMKRLVRDLDAESKGSGESFARILGLLWKSPSYELLAEMRTRFHDRSYPEMPRRILMEYLLAPDLEPLALRPDDPLAPVAWIRSLGRRYDENHMHAGLRLRVRSEVAPAELRRLWARALASPDPWALPPELEIDERVP